MENKNMTKCKACGKDIAKGVKKCPSCGKDQRNFFMKHKILSVIAIFVILGVIGSIGGNKNTATTSTNDSSTTASKENATEESTTKKEESITVSAADLAKAYEDNEVNADKSYKGKNAIITGTIRDIGVSLGQTYIVLDSEVEFSITDIQCFFKDQTEIDKVAQLSKGSTVTVEGKIDGKSINVGVNNCKLK